MFLKPLKAQTMWKTLEIIIAKRMQNMGQIENKNIIFVAKIHFDILLHKVENYGGEWKSIFHPSQRGMGNPCPEIGARLSSDFVAE